LETKEDNEEVPERLVKFFDNAKESLAQPFNFYSFSVTINNENKLDIIGRVYNRILQKKIIDLDENFFVKT
jgi:hypothetical protein